MKVAKARELPSRSARVRGTVGRSGSAYASGTTARDDHLDVFYALSNQLQSIEQAGASYYSGAVLIVVHDRYVDSSLNLWLNEEALRCLHVFNIDATKSRRNSNDGINELLRVRLIDLDVKGV